jgi:3-oxoacyl-[acyl-carrier protein] reductase
MKKAKNSHVPVILITGTRTGLGKHLVGHYLQLGYTVIGCSRNSIDFEMQDYHHFTLDIQDENAVKKMFSNIRKSLGRVDVLVNNAGVSSKNFALLTSVTELRKVLNTNFVGPFILCREAVKLMKKKKYGRIVNISSVHVPFGSPGTSAYGASKASLEQFSRVLAKEVFPFGITVNTLGLSVVNNTGMHSNLDEINKQMIIDQTVSKLLLEISDITHVLDFLISEKSTLLTSQTLYLGGV